MAVQAYILVQTEVGKAADVARAIAEIDGVTMAEDVTGPTTSSSAPKAPASTSSAPWSSPRSRAFPASPAR